MCSRRLLIAISYNRFCTINAIAAIAVQNKGKLRLIPKNLLRGGKDGKVLVPGKSDEVKYERLLLDPLEKHMPPKGRPQLTEAETNIIHWWINAGASFDQKGKTCLRMKNKTCIACIAKQ